MIAHVVARAENNVIGAKNDLPWYLPADLRHFKLLTMGQTVAMGTHTFRSILDRLGHPLPGRSTVVVARERSFRYPGVRVVHSIEQLRTLAADIYICGGAELYRTTLPMADTLYVTEVHAAIAGDTYYPSLDIAQWREESRQSHAADEKNAYAYDFVVYRRAQAL